MMEDWQKAVFDGLIKVLIMLMAFMMVKLVWVAEKQANALVNIQRIDEHDRRLDRNRVLMDRMDKRVTQLENEKCDSVIVP